jgi:hypothetical protein
VGVHRALRSIWRLAGVGSGRGLQLEQQPSRLQQVRWRARRQSGPEGERLEAQTETRLRDIDQRISDLRASLE